MLSRRSFMSGSAAVALSAASGRAQQRRLFDSHCHIIDHRFPIVANQGYTPPNFPLEDYLAQVKPLGVVAGAVVSGSFQANDQTYLMDILPRLGAGWVGVTQIPNDHPDAEIAKLGKLGVRAVRFNVFRGRIDSVDDIVALATRCHAVAGWHSEIYADAAALYQLDPRAQVVLGRTNIYSAAPVANKKSPAALPKRKLRRLRCIGSLPAFA